MATAGGCSVVGKYCSLRWNANASAHTPTYPIAAALATPEVIPMSKPPSLPSMEGSAGGPGAAAADAVIVRSGGTPPAGSMRGFLHPRFGP